MNKGKTFSLYTYPRIDVLFDSLGFTAPRLLGYHPTNSELEKEDIESVYVCLCGLIQ